MDFAFDFPNGDLVGQGPWLAAPGVADHPVILDSEVDSGPSGGGAAYVEDVLDQFDLSAVVAVETDFVMRATVLSRGYIDVVLGDLTGFASAIQIDTNTTYASLNQVGILVDDSGGGMSEISSVPCPWFVPHTARIEFDGLVVRTYLDGVLVHTGTGSGLAALSSGDLGLYYSDSGPPPTVYVTGLRVIGTLA